MTAFLQEASMSFDLHLQHFSRGNSASVDPAPVVEVLAKENYTGPDPFGFYCVEFADGTTVEFNASGLNGQGPFSGCAFHVRGMGNHLVRFVFDVARAGNFVIFNCQGNDSQESPVLIMVRSDQTEHLPGDLTTQYESRPVCTSPEMLGALLFSDYDEWQDYRDQIVHK
jgi:hypothetical protein